MRKNDNIFVNTKQHIHSLRIQTNNMTTECANFYEVLDNVFDALFEKEGDFTEELIGYKSQLIDVYENEDKRKSNKILKFLTPINWYIDSEGCFKVVEKKDE